MISVARVLQAQRRGRIVGSMKNLLDTELYQATPLKAITRPPGDPPRGVPSLRDTGVGLIAVPPEQVREVRLEQASPRLALASQHVQHLVVLVVFFCFVSALCERNLNGSHGGT